MQCAASLALRHVSSLTAGWGGLLHPSLLLQKPCKVRVACTIRIRCICRAQRPS